MSNKSVSADFFRIYGMQHDVEGCGPLFADDAVVNSSTAPGPMNFDAYRQVGYAFLAAFDDLYCHVLEQIEEGNKVVSRVVWGGTHTGELQGIPATGRKFESVGITIDTIEDGKITERWDISDMLSMLQQLGIIPAMA